MIFNGVVPKSKKPGFVTSKTKTLTRPCCGHVLEPKELRANNIPYNEDEIIKEETK